jgi:hypothetical protein
MISLMHKHVCAALVLTPLGGMAMRHRFLPFPCLRFVRSGTAPGRITHLPAEMPIFSASVRKRRSTRAFALIRTLGRTVGFPNRRPLRSRIEEQF